MLGHSGIASLAGWAVGCYDTTYTKVAWAHLLSTRTGIWICYFKATKQVVHVGGVLPLLQGDMCRHLVGCQGVSLPLWTDRVHLCCATQKLEARWMDRREVNFPCFAVLWCMNKGVAPLVRPCSTCLKLVSSPHHHM